LGLVLQELLFLLADEDSPSSSAPLIVILSIVSIVFIVVVVPIFIILTVVVFNLYDRSSLLESSCLLGLPGIELQSDTDVLVLRFLEVISVAQLAD
jgi:hypothetical protein